MNGLLLKEFYSLKNNLIFFIIYFICIIIGFSSSQNSLQAYAGVLTFVIIHTSTSYDEKSKWDTYSISLPCSRAMIVSSKYLFALILTVIAIIPGIIFNAINDYNPSFALLSFQSFIIPGIGLLCDFYFGATKSYLASFFLAIFILVPVFFSNLITAVVPNSFMVNFIIAIISIFIYGISWLLAIVLYKKRQL